MYRGVKGHMENMALAKKKKKDKSASSKPSWPSIGDFGVGPVSPTKNVRQVRFLNMVHLNQGGPRRVLGLPKWMDQIKTSVCK